MKNYFFFFFSIFSLWVAESQSHMIIVDSERADYDGNKLILNGSVYVEHEIGEVGCNEAVLIPKGGKGSNQRLSFLRLKEGVKLHLWDGGMIQCERADIDYQTLTGVFAGGADQEYVTYIDSFPEGKKEPLPLIVKGKKMTVQLVDDHSASQGQSAYTLDNIIAEGNVTVDYAGEYIALSDRVIYQLPSRRLSLSSKKTEGVIYLQPIGQGGVCQISNIRGDRIHSKQMRIDCKKGKIRFEEPKGVVHVSSLPSYRKHSEGDLSQKMDFSSKVMVWDNPSLRLMLYEDVHLYQHGFGSVEAEERVQLQQRLVEGKKQLHWVSSTGKTSLQFTDRNQFSHRLISHGGMLIDHVNLVVTMSSPNIGEEVPSNKQVFFIDHLGEIYANRVHIHYKLEGEKAEPEKVLLNGNVAIINRNSQGKEDKQALLHYALADRVEYYPQTHQMALESDGKRRVLLYDIENNLHVSAEAIDIERDGRTGKEAFKGRGRVRFSFAKEEVKRLKETFSFDPISDLGAKGKMR